MKKCRKSSASPGGEIAARKRFDMAVFFLLAEQREHLFAWAKEACRGKVVSTSIVGLLGSFVAHRYYI